MATEGRSADLAPTAAGLRSEAKAENFPVASWLLAAGMRPHVVAFYNFVRGADQIADDPNLSPMERLARLERFARGLDTVDAHTPPESRALAASIAVTGIGRDHALALLAAFRIDVTEARHADLASLRAYCRLSADPVGRFLLDLHGEDATLHPASDGLCTALQILNHIQDVKTDRARLDRVYVPQDWMSEAGVGDHDLLAPHATPALRRVLGRLLDVVDADLAIAEGLRGLRARRLRMEAGAILALAKALARRLRHRDPIAHRVALGRTAKLAVGLIGALGALR